MFSRLGMWIWNRRGLSAQAAVALRARLGERGATAVEYGLMVSLVAVIIIGGITFFGQKVDLLYVIPGGALNGP